MMNSTQIYQVQEHQLSELAIFLERFRQEIQQYMQDYQRQVDSMYELGLPQETYKKFQADHIDVIKSLVDKIVDHVESQSLPFTKQNIERMQELIQFNQ